MAAVPKMDRVSVTFALMLDSFRIEDSSPSKATADIHYLVCSLCEDRLCEVEDGDTMRVLFNTALAHSC